MKKQVVKFDFNKPEEAREFLRGLYFRGNRVTGVQVKNGEWIEFSDCTDEQAMDFASQIWTELMSKDEKQEVLEWKPSLH